MKHTSLTPQPSASTRSLPAPALVRAAAPLRSRTSKMDALAKRVSTSPKFSLEAAAAAVNAAMSKAKTTA